MIHIDPLFYKQTPKFDLGKSCPVLCYLYIFKKKHFSSSRNIFDANMYDHDFYLYWSKPKENFHLEKSVLFCVIKTGNKFWVYFVQ